MTFRGSPAVQPHTSRSTRHMFDTVEILQLRYRGWDIRLILMSYRRFAKNWDRVSKFNNVQPHLACGKARRGHGKFEDVHLVLLCVVVRGLE